MKNSLRKTNIKEICVFDLLDAFKVDAERDKALSLSNNNITSINSSINIDKETLVFNGENSDDNIIFNNKFNVNSNLINISSEKKVETIQFNIKEKKKNALTNKKKPANKKKIKVTKLLAEIFSESSKIIYNLDPETIEKID